MSDFSPIYGLNPSGVAIPVIVDTLGRLLTAAGAGTSIAINDNSVQTRHWTITALGTGLVSPTMATALTPFASNPTQTAAAGADTTYSFGAAGTTQFLHVTGQNNTPANVFLAFDQSTTTAGNAVYVIAPGQFFSFDRQGTVLHFSSPAQQAFGGQSGITVEAYA